MRVSITTTPPPSGKQPPARLVPAPRAITGDAVPSTEPDDAGHLAGRLWENNQVGLVLLDGEAVALIDHQFGRIREHVGCAQEARSSSPSSSIVCGDMTSSSPAVGRTAIRNRSL